MSILEYEHQKSQKLATRLSKVYHAETLLIDHLPFHSIVQKYKRLRRHLIAYLNDISANSFTLLTSKK